MRIYELQKKYPLQNLINLTRLQDTSPKELSQIHIDFGTMLGREILGLQAKQTRLQTLTQGNKEELLYYDESDFVIISILRAGLYIGEGLRVALPNAAFYAVKMPSELNANDLRGKKIILCDAVINTGKTMEGFLQMCENNCVYIATNVIFAPTAERLLSFHGLKIFCIRTSSNSYQGKGGFDTGNRLFGSLR